MDEEKNLNGEKPLCPLIGQDGNIFNLVGIAARTLREAGLRDQAKDWWIPRRRIWNSP